MSKAGIFCQAIRIAPYKRQDINEKRYPTLNRLTIMQNKTMSMPCTIYSAKPNSMPRIRLRIYAGATSIESPYPDVVSIATDKASSTIAARYTASLESFNFFIFLHRWFLP